MDVILKQIDRALDRGFHYLAVVSALTLPDICAALQSGNGETSKAKYQAWYIEWLGKKYPFMNEEDIYRLRSGVVHQGILGPSGMQYTRIVFMLPAHGLHIHNCISDNSTNGGERVLQVDTATFCRDSIESVKEWYSAKKDDVNVMANMPRLLQFRPHGLPPHFVGMPVIA